MSERASLEERGSRRLAGRRRRNRRRALVASGILLTILIGALFYVLSQPSLRISHVVVYGAGQSLATIAIGAMQGSYFGIPRDSTFLVPEARIRALVMAADPAIAAVSIFRDGLTGISIKVDYRVPIARWCGSSSASTSPEDSPGKEVTPTVSGDCYLFDASGFLYATATEPFFLVAGKASSSPAVGAPNRDNTLTPFVLFDALQTTTLSPVGATLENAYKLPSVFDFARQLATLNSSVGAIVIRNDEVDFFLASSTDGAVAGPRITYLLGDEQNAFSALASARADLNFTNGSINYIDLRFPGKIYVKKTGSLP